MGCFAPSEAPAVIAQRRFASLAARLREEGSIYSTPAGVVLSRPEVQILDAARRVAQRLVDELRLTPMSPARLRIELRQPPARSPASCFFE